MTVYLAFNEAEGLDNSANTEEAVRLVDGDSGIRGPAETGVNRAGFCFTDAGATSATATMSSALTEGWVHVIQKSMHPTLGGLNSDTFQVLDTSGNPVVSIRVDDTGSTVTFGGFTYLDTPNNTILMGPEDKPDNVYRVDLHIKMDATAGFIRAYVNSILIHEEFGVDTTVTSGVTQFDTLKFLERGGTTIFSEGNAQCWSQVLVSDRTTIGAKVYTLVPNATGSLNDWDSGAYTDVDETAVNDVDKATTTTNGDEFTVDVSTTLATPSLPNKWTALVQTFRGSYDSGSAVTKMSPLLNDTTSTSTSYGASQTLTTGFANYSKIWDVDPADSGDWTATRINNYEFGVRADT